MEEQDVNNFSQSVIPEFGTSVSAAIMPGIWQGVNKIVQGQANKAELERKKNQEIASITEELDPEVVWEVDQGELLKFAKEQGGLLTKEAMDKKYNMDELNYGEFAEKVKSTKKELSIKTKKAQENKTAFDKVQEEYKKQTGLGDDADFDLEHMDAWINKFKNAGSIEERNAMLRDTEYTPYKRNYALLDMALAMLPKPKSVTDASGATKVFVDEEAYANKIFEYVSSQDGEGYYEKFKTPDENKEAFAERMANKFINDDRIVSESFRAPSPAKSGSVSGSTKKPQGKTLTNDITVEGNTIKIMPVGDNYEHNAIEFKTTGRKDLVNAAGKTISGTPRAVVLGIDNQKYIEVVLESGGVAYVPYNKGGNESLVLKETGATDDNALNAMFKGKAKGKSTTTKSTTKSTDSKPKNAAEALRKSNAEKKK